MRVLCYGDSNTWGYDAKNNCRFPYNRRWCGILSGLLGDSAEIYEQGLGGRTTAFDDPLLKEASGLASLPYVKRSVFPLDFAVIMLGTNDSKTHLHLNAECVKNGIEELIKTIKTPFFDSALDCNPRVVLISPPRILPRKSAEAPSPAFGEDSVRIIEQLPALYAELAKKYDCDFVDAFSVLSGSSFDGIHLDEQGHKKLAYLVYDKITENLQAKFFKL